MLLGKLEDAIHLRHLTVEMYRHDCSHGTLAAPADEPPRSVSRTAFFEESP
jgi:hypothetical protein